MNIRQILADPNFSAGILRRYISFDLFRLGPRGRGFYVGTSRIPYHSPVCHMPPHPFKIFTRNIHFMIHIGDGLSPLEIFIQEFNRIHLNLPRIHMITNIPRHHLHTLCLRLLIHLRTQFLSSCFTEVIVQR